MIAQLIFAAVLITFGYFIFQKVRLIAQTIHLGKPLEADNTSTSERFKNMALVALGQQKMFDKPLVAILHLAVYIGFVLINLELIEIQSDGLFGTHRFLHTILGGFYTGLINFFEILALAVVLACIIFLVRRNVLKVNRFQKDRHMEMRNWPSLDANIILFIEIALMMAFFKMNAADAILQERGLGHFAEVKTGPFVISQFLIPILKGFSDNTLVLIERAGWWFHIVGILCFALYMTYSKHLHIVLAFPNTYFANLNNIGKMTNMPTVSTEVKIMLGLEQAPSTPSEVGRFGAKDVTDLSWKSLMDAYTCTECGRCTEQCPANKTGKMLSPRKIMMDTRDRLEDLQKVIKLHGKDFKDEKSLLGDYIIDEEILACTSCNACVEACPVQISPLSIILELRRFRVMEESKAPGSWNAMFQNLETNMAPWKFSPDQRFDWAKEA
jgi:heterodisulfide reductase subunit C